MIPQSSQDFSFSECGTDVAVTQQLAMKSIIKEIRVSSWHDLHESLFDQSWQKQLSRCRSPYGFRGMQQASSELRSSLARLGEGRSSFVSPSLSATWSGSYRPGTNWAETGDILSPRVDPVRSLLSHACPVVDDSQKRPWRLHQSLLARVRTLD